MSQVQDSFSIIDDTQAEGEHVFVAKLYDGDASASTAQEADPANKKPFEMVQRRRHIEMFWTSIVVLICATVFQTPDGHRVALPGMSNMPLPEVCMSKAWFGVSCPGCGLTRSFISMMHGRLGDAFSYNRVGPILFLFTVLQIPYRWIGLKTRQAFPLGRRVASGSVWLLIGLLIGNWLISFVI